eukprot:3239426-Rhodomonas_salina.1
MPSMGSVFDLSAELSSIFSPVQAQQHTFTPSRPTRHLSEQRSSKCNALISEEMGENSHQQESQIRNRRTDVSELMKKKQCKNQSSDDFRKSTGFGLNSTRTDMIEHSESDDDERPGSWSGTPAVRATPARNLALPGSKAPDKGFWRKRERGDEWSQRGRGETQLQQSVQRSSVQPATSARGTWGKIPSSYASSAGQSLSPRSSGPRRGSSSRITPPRKRYHSSSRKSLPDTSLPPGFWD